MVCPSAWFVACPVAHLSVHVSTCMCFRLSVCIRRNFTAASDPLRRSITLSILIEYKGYISRGISSVTAWHHSQTMAPDTLPVQPPAGSSFPRRLAHSIPIDEKGGRHAALPSPSHNSTLRPSTRVR